MGVESIERSGAKNLDPPFKVDVRSPKEAFDVYVGRNPEKCVVS